ncbi:MAG: discoidin domain-containing protein [Tannerellaceae bacterium]|jgi:hypothetical protein|nr:discoidin domain-containing protein [Tannerellaceae bacterium]
MKLYHFFCFVSIFLTACSTNTGNELEYALRLADNNRGELEKVLNHYHKNPKDSLKYKAAVFLITNMPGKYSEDDKPLNSYTPLLTDWNEMCEKGLASYKSGILDSLISIYHLESARKKLFDVNFIKADYLINNIECSFKVWESQPWGKDIPFDRFCEEILPYRLETEPLEDWRNIVLSQYKNLYDSLRTTDIDAVTACTKVLLSINDKWFLGDKGTLPALTYSMTENFRTGTCLELVNLTTFVMRALGIPVTRDFTPQWPHRASKHDWNTILDKDGKRLLFGLTENIPGEPYKPDHKMAKAFRKTYQKNPISFNKDVYMEYIPILFKNQFIKDVSKEDFPTVDVTIHPDCGIKKGYLLYLNVFNNQNWVPIQYSKTSDPAIFPSMGKNIVYLPAYYDNNKLIPCTSPFILSQNSEIHWLKADTSKFQKLTLLRKYPIMLSPNNRMKGGRFQASNFPDFSNAVDLFEIVGTPDLYFQDVIIDQPQEYRYYRYLSPEKANCNIAELEFYGKANEETKMIGRMIGTQGSWNNNPLRTFDKAFDGNVLTFYDAAKSDGKAWVGMDFGKRVKITKIRYLPRNDDNTIATGQTYELFYWGDKGWISLGRQIPTQQVLYYEAPSNALFLLRNLSKGKEERIFTYENDKQVWW